jgi:hypothetical protein
VDRIIEYRPPALVRTLDCFLVLLALACACGLILGPYSGRVQALGNIYYVSPAGNDSNLGTETEPFRTIQRAANLVNPGDTVIVEDGTYTGTGIGTSCASSASRPIVCLSRGGSSGNLVTFKARNVGGARLDGQDNTSTDGFRFLANANYIQIDGFEIYGIGNAVGSASGLEIYNGGHDVVITRNNIHDVGRLCTDTTNGQVAIFVEQPRVSISRNTIHDIGRLAPGENGCSPLTAYYRNHDHGVYVDGQSSGTGIPGANDTFIADNIFYNHKRGWAIQLYPGTLARVSILNNTFAFPNPYNDGHIILAASMSDGRIENNVFYSPRGAAIYYYSGNQTNLQVGTNIVSGGSLLTATPAGVMLTGNKTGDPMLVNTLLAPYDFHLTALSPAINAGTTLAEVPVDFDGALRSDGAYDLGAFEFGGVSGDPVNAAPIVAVTSPVDHASFSDASIITFSAIASDVEDGDLSSRIEWTSSVEGSLGIGASLTRTLTPGTHVITARVTDSAGATDSGAVTIVVTSATSGISIAARGYLVLGLPRTEITWSGAKGARVDIYRNGERIQTTKNDGRYVDGINLSTSATYSYQVCERRSTICSAVVEVSF